MLLTAIWQLVIILLIAMLKEGEMENKIWNQGQRSDKALSDLTELSRSLANEQIKADKFWLIQTEKAKYTVQEGDVATTMCQNRGF